MHAIIAWPDKLRTGPMVVDGVGGRRRRNENGLTAGRDGRTCLARPNYQERTETRKFYFHCPANREQD